MTEGLRLLVVDVDILTTGLLGILPTLVDSWGFVTIVAGDIVSGLVIANVFELFLEVDLESNALTRVLLAALASSSSVMFGLSDVVLLDIDSGCLSRSSWAALTSCWMTPETTKASAALELLSCLRVRWPWSVRCVLSATHWSKLWLFRCKDLGL